MGVRVLLCCVLWLAAACGALDRRLTREFIQPRRDVLTTPASFGLEYEDVWIEVSAGVRLHGWWLPLADGGAGTVMLLHGSRANIGSYFPFYRFLHAGGLQVFLYDYRAYGESEGENSLRAMVRDMRPVLAWLRSHEGVDPQRVGVLGLSLGSILALELASQQPSIAAVVVEDCVSPDVELAHVLRRRGHGFLARNFLQAVVDLLGVPWGLEPVENAARIDQPLLVIQGEQDVDRYLAISRRVFECARGPKRAWFVPGAGHVPAPLAYRDGVYQEVVVGFFREAFAGELRGTGAELIEPQVGDRPRTPDGLGAAHHDACRALAAAGDGEALDRFLERGPLGPGWTPRLEAALADLLVERGEHLLSSPDPRIRTRGQALLERALAAVPERPRCYWWGGNGGYHAGFPWGAQVRHAAEILGPGYQADGDSEGLARIAAALARLDGN